MSGLYSTPTTSRPCHDCTIQQRTELVNICTCLKVSVTNLDVFLFHFFGISQKSKEEEEEEEEEERRMFESDRYGRRSLMMTTPSIEYLKFERENVWFEFVFFVFFLNKASVTATTGSSGSSPPTPAATPQLSLLRRCCHERVRKVKN